jgi:hypothetical protein
MEESKLLAKLEKISHTTALPSAKHADAGSRWQIFATTLVKINVIIMVASTTVLLNQNRNTVLQNKASLQLCNLDSEVPHCHRHLIHAPCLSNNLVYLCRLSSVKSSKWQDYWGAIQFANFQQQMLVENVGILSLRHENIALRNEFERRFDVLSQLIESGFATVHGNVRRVAMQPV